MLANMNYRDLLAEARAIHFSMQHGAITYEEAQNRVKPVLIIINKKIDEIAKKYSRRPHHIKFQDLGRTF
jgi:hypothetical protein